LYSELRSNGVRNTGEVEFAFLELGGQLSVFTYDSKNDYKSGIDIVPISVKDDFMKV